MENINIELYEEIKYSLRQYLYYKKYKIPYCTLKIALSIDNCYVSSEGSSKWISNEKSRKEGHLLRASSQAIIIGALTAQKDDPELTVRYDIDVKKQPLRVVIDGNSLISSPKKVLSNGTVIMTTNELIDKWQSCLCGVNCVVMSEVTPRKILEKLSNMYPIMHVLVEGGGKIQKSFCSEKLINEIVIFRSSKVFGQNAYNWDALPKDTNLKLVESKHICGDIMERYLVEYNVCKNVCKNDLCNGNLCNGGICNNGICNGNICNGNICNGNICNGNICNGDLRNDDNLYPFDDLKNAIRAFEKGEMVLVMDDEDRENEGDLIVAASKMTESQMTEMINHTSGIICVTMEESNAKRLNLPLMCSNNTDTFHTAFTVTVDSVETTTGVSSKDRLKTIKKIADKNSIPNDLRRPGHIFPLISHNGGLQSRRGHTEASIALCYLSGILPRVAVIGELQNKDGTMKRRKECYLYAKANNIPIISINQIENEMKNYIWCKMLASCNIKSKIGDHEWKLMCFDYGNKNEIYKVFVYETIQNEIIPVRIHSECFTGDVFMSLHCDCGDQLKESMDYITNKGKGIIIFPPNQEGRGIGFLNKVKAYNLQQNNNLDTFEANEHLGLNKDARTYVGVKEILNYLNVSKINLLTENPDKIMSVGNMVNKIIPITMIKEFNANYLKTKLIEFKKETPIIDISNIDKTNLKVAFVYSSWYSSYIQLIRNKLRETLESVNVFNIREVECPGSNELPFSAMKIAKEVDVIICIGILLKGDTLHFENVSSAVSNGIMQAQLQTGIPIMNCVLSCQNIEQVLDRITGKHSTLDYIAFSAIKMSSL